MGLARTIKSSWRIGVVVLTPLLLSPLIFSVGSQESKCAFMLCLCAVLFITESFPLYITSLLPVALCPMLGLISSKNVCKVFFADISFLLLGGIFVAIAIEESNMHRRVALKILLLIGVQPKRLLFAMMGTTAFMSMWISNTASFSMMMPILRALLKTMFDSRRATAAETESVFEAQEDKNLDKGVENGSGDADYTPPILLKEYTPVSDGSHCTQEGAIDYSNTDSYGTSLQEPQIIIENAFELPEERKKLYFWNEEHQKTGANNAYEDGKLTPTGYHDDGNTYDSDGDIIERGAKEGGKDGDEDGKRTRSENKEEEEEEDTSFDTYSDECRQMVQMFSLGVCYAANIGGIGTLIGSPPNLVVAAMAEDLAEDGSSPITFAAWTSYGMPVALLSLAICYLWISVAAFGLRNTFCCARLSSEEEDRLMKQTIEKRYRKCGSIKFAEKVVFVHFLILVSLWLTRKIGTNPGWAILLSPGHASDGMAAVAVSISLFIFPRYRPNVLFFRKKSDTSPPRSMPSVLSWKRACRQFPWGLLFLIGGGFVLAKATRETGLSKVFANNLSFVSALPPWLTTVILTTLTCFATEITANTVVTMLLMPVVSTMAIDATVNPLLYMMPVGVAASFAFMLPVATGPNALLYAYGDVTITKFMKTGLVMNILGIIVASVALNSLGYAVFSLGDFPDWLNATANDVTTTSPGLNLYNYNLTQFTNGDENGTFLEAF